MGDGDPYRTSAGAACPRCATPLVAGAAGEPIACSAGCGAWYPPAVVDDELAPVMSQPRDAIAWWKTPKGALPRCPDCGGDLRGVPIARTFVFRCEAHGVWLDAGAREHLETALADAFARHREAVALARVLAGRDERALRQVTARLLDLERRIAQLERRTP